MDSGWDTRRGKLVGYAGTCQSRSATSFLV